MSIEIGLGAFEDPDLSEKLSLFKVEKWMRIHDLNRLSDRPFAMIMMSEEELKWLGTESFIQFVKSQPMLVDLDLSGEDVEFELSWIENIQQIQSLQELSLTYLEFSDSVLNNLSKLKRLHTLRFQNTHLSDQKLEFLKAMPTLRRFGLEQEWQLTDDALPYLTCNTQLEALSLSESHITGETLHLLAELPSLHWLDLSMSALSDQNASQLLQLKYLKKVNLSYTDINDTALNKIMHLETLRELHIVGTECSLEAKEFFKKERPDVKLIDNYSV